MSASCVEMQLFGKTFTLTSGNYFYNLSSQCGARSRARTGRRTPKSLRPSSFVMQVMNFILLDEAETCDG